jgi:hypothetical protein
MSNNIQILNYNHNVISLSNGNTIIITDNVKGNSISIPQPVTSILQINSPGPQGPAGANGSSINTGSFATTGSNTFRGNQTITGSIIFNSGSQITSTYYGNNYPGYIDIVAGAPGGFVELLSYNQSSSVNVDDYSVYITTQSGSLFNLWEFKRDGRLIAPRGIEAPSFTGSLQGTSSYATTASYAMNGGGTTINTSSFVTTSSFNSFTQSINTATSSFVTNSQTSSFVTNNQTSSFVQNSQTSSFVQNSQTSSFVQNSQTSSFVLTSSLKALSGSVASFGGTPKSSSITLASSFPNNLYAVTVTGEDARIWTIQSKTSVGFTINSNSSVALTGPVYWIATAYN